MTETPIVEERDASQPLMVGGCTWMVQYPARDELLSAVTSLITDGHGHHFVVNHEGSALVCSEMAIECLRTRRKLP